MGYYNHYSKWHNHKDPNYVKYMKAKFQRMFGEYLPSSKGSAILEIGCSNGMAMASLKDMGYTNLLGIEMDKELADIAKSFDLEVENQDVLNYVKTTPKKFDFIYMFDVLEHLNTNQIPELLEDLYELLNDNGKLMMVVPNATSPAGSYFRYIDWTHQTSYTPTSISFLLEEAGFKSILITDESLIHEPQISEYEYIEAYNNDKRQSDRARFYESFARWELTSMFGADPYNSLVAPNMKIVACKAFLDEVDLKILPSSDKLFDLEAWANELLEIKQQLSGYKEHMLLLEQESKVSADSVNEIILKLESTSQSISTITSIVENNMNEIRLHSFEHLQLKNQLDRFKINDENNEAKNKKLTEALLTIFKKSQLKKQQSLWDKVFFKVKGPYLKKIIKNSGLFDVNFYLTNYSDVKLSGMDPIYHYLSYGAYEGRNPSELFDTDDYILNNPEIFVSKMNPLIHKIKFNED